MSRRLVLALVLLLSAVPAAADDPAMATDGASPQSSAFAPDRVIVQWSGDADHGEKVAARANAEVEFSADLGNREFQLVETESGQTTGDAVSLLESDPAVAVAERDVYRSLDSVPDDPLFGQLWGLHNVGTGIDGFSGAVAGDDADVTAAWDRTVGSPSTVVADIDSGYRFNDPDLGPVAWANPGEIAANGIDDDGNGYVDDVHGYDFVGPSVNDPTEDADPTDDDLITGGHGVHTAGTIGAAGDNGVGISGVARNVRIMPLRVCSDYVNSESKNEDKCPLSGILAAINYAGDMHARVANMSLGGNTFTQTEVNAIAAHPQTLFVISAGNDGSDNDAGEAAPKGHHYPCDYAPTTNASPPVTGAIDNVVCVAATNQADGLASFSDWGATSVDLGAPGTETLSTFPGQDSLATDDFQVNDFATAWSTGEGTGFGRAEPPEPHLTSAGITDTPGATAGSGSIYEVRQTTSTTIPGGEGSCEVKGLRFRHGGTLSYGVYVDGVKKSFTTSADTSGSAMVPFNTIPILGLAGHSVQIFFKWTAPASPTGGDGFWIDDVRLQCFASTSAPDGFEFLQGTSMAAPHVTGTAALLFSLKPTASVTEVRNALLQSVHKVPSLQGKTTSGGRLDAAAALAKLVPVGSETVPPETAITASPPSSTKSTSAELRFERTDADASAFECRLDGASFSACVSPQNLTVAAGGHEFQVRAKVLGGTLADPTPASASWTVVASEGGTNPGGGGGTEGGGGNEKPAAGCTVPKLAGLSLGQAKAALKSAGCTLGTVGKPKAKKGHAAPALVVKSSSPAAGTSATGAVSLKLGPKPKKHHH